MLDTRFPRLAGDIGNPEGFPFPIVYETVAGASPLRIVVNQDKDMVAPFIDAGKRLIARGADIRTTSCGFLILFQQHLESELDVPVVSSSLLMFGDLEKKFGKGRVAVQTISASSIGPDMLEAANIPACIPIGTTESGTAFNKAILGNLPTFDTEQCGIDNVEAARRIISENCRNPARMYQHGAACISHQRGGQGSGFFS